MTDHDKRTRRESSWEVSDRDRLPTAPMVSVLMPAYNHGAYLAEAIESVLGQETDFSFELLIGEDCSTDNTREIALAYQRQNPNSIRVITGNRNVGMHSNHRRIVDASRGKYMAYCEGDDYWKTSGKLNHQVHFLEGHPSFGAVHGHYARVARVRGAWRSAYQSGTHATGRMPEGDVFPIMLQRNLIQTCTVMIRGDLVRKYFRSPLSANNYEVGDWPLFLFVSKLSLVGFLDEALAVYRKVPGSMMNQGVGAQVSQLVSYLQMTSDFCRYFNVSSDVEIAARRELMLGLLRHAIAAGDITHAERAISWLDEHAPEAMTTWRGRVWRLATSQPAVGFAYRNYCGVRADLRELLTFRAPPERFDGLSASGL